MKRVKYLNYIIGRNNLTIEDRQKMETAREALLSLLFPRRCPVCHEIVTPVGELVCEKCRDKIAWIREPVCRCCGKEISSWEEEICYDCSRYHRPVAGGVSLMNYDAVGQGSMIWFKYKGRQEYADFYGRELWLRYGEQIRNFHGDVLIPVPIHGSRRRERGYNQAEVLARVLSRESGIPLRTDILVRSRKTTVQKKLNAAQRQRNLEEALEVKKPTGKYRRVILVDDIYTTGSTLTACAAVLMRAGVKEVFVVTVCIGKNQ